MGFSFDTLINVIKNPLHPPDPTDPFGKNLGMAKTPGQLGTSGAAAAAGNRDMGSELSGILSQISPFTNQAVQAQQTYGPQLTQANLGNFRTALMGPSSFDASGYLQANQRLVDEWNRSPEDYAKVYGTIENYAQADYTNNGNNDPRFIKYGGGAIDLTRQAYTAANPELMSYTASLPSLLAQLQGNAPGAVPTATYQPASYGAATYGAATYQPATAAFAGANATRANLSSANGGPLLGLMRRDAGANLGQVTPMQLMQQQQAMQLLGAGSNLTPGELLNAQDSARTAYGDRGMLRSNRGVGAEILATDQARRDRLLQNMSLASGVDAAGQQQIYQNRGYAQGVQGQDQNLSTFNTGQANVLSQFNAGLLTDLSKYNSGLRTANNQFNAGQLNTAGQFNAGQTNTAGQYNAGQLNSAGQFNAGAANTAGAFNATAGNNMGQFNANLAGTNANDAWNRQMGYGSYLNTQRIDPTTLASGLMGNTPDYTAQLLNYGSDVYNTNLNAASAAQIAAGNNSAATNGAMINGIGSIAGAALMVF